MTETQARSEPLYTQIRARLIGRIASGAWKPGDLIPSEIELARELGVSQGTVRKAVLALEAERLVVRFQGRGTFVAQHTSSRALFHFFRIVGPQGRRSLPTSVVLSHRVVAAGASDRAALGLPEGAKVHAISRLRRLEGAPVILERVTVPHAAMPRLRLPIGREMADELYVIYQQDHGVTIARAREELTAVTANAADSRHLGVARGAPLLQVLRTALDVEGRPAELRASRCVTGHWRYAAEVI